jgi:catechol 2,3-dioxygenase-like lactoylglutathione lyase family enzyme
MKRLHLHVSVKDLAASIRFYQTLFGAEELRGMRAQLEAADSRMLVQHPGLRRGYSRFRPRRVDRAC